MGAPRDLVAEELVGRHPFVFRLVNVALGHAAAEEAAEHSILLLGRAVAVDHALHRDDVNPLAGLIQLRLNLPHDCLDASRSWSIVELQPHAIVQNLLHRFLVAVLHEDVVSAVSDVATVTVLIVAPTAKVEGVAAVKTAARGELTAAHLLAQRATSERRDRRFRLDAHHEAAAARPRCLVGQDCGESKCCSAQATAVLLRRNFWWRDGARHWCAGARCWRHEERGRQPQRQRQKSAGEQSPRHWPR
mmetsp:Transcript_87439/g.209183  ORF Transcript_87439/g.209183 Transcript_87439/m.209183 type:complete len:247 (-) Transcript_87439:33-773(-)